MLGGFKGRYFSLAAILATVSLCAIKAEASSMEAKVERVVVSAAKSTQNEDELTEDIEVVTAEEIARRGYKTLKELLESLNGVETVSSGGYGQPASIFLYGLPTDRTLVLIDGIRFNDVTGLNGAPIEHILLENVERIEIIKGSQSGVWGADAVAGVINIVTKRAHRDGTLAEAKVYGGSYDTKSVSVLFSKKSGDLDFTFDYSRFDTQGLSAAEPGQNSPLYGNRADDLGWEKDAYENTTLGLGLGYDISDSDRVELSYKNIDATVHYDAGAGVDALDGPFTVNRINDKFYRVSYGKRISNHDMEASFSYSGFKRSQFGGYTGSFKEYEIKDKISYWKNSFFQIGGGYQRFWQGLSAGADLNEDYHNRYLFVTNYNRIGKLILSESFRMDDYDRFEDKNSYKLGAKYIFYADYALGANYSTGYNVPTLYRLYGSFVGNADLKPESSKSFNLYVGNDTIKATFFKTRVKDFIDFDLNSFTYYNIEGISTFKGVELKYSDSLYDEFFAEFGYTRFIATDSNGERFPRRANWKGTYRFSWFPTDEHTVVVQGYYVGARYDTNDVQTGKYNVTNVTLRHNFAPAFTGEVKIVNIFDRFYQEVDGYSGFGRSIYVGVSMSY